MHLIPAIGRQRQTGLCELKASLVYTVSSRTVRATTWRNPVSKPSLPPNPPPKKKKEERKEKMSIFRYRY